MENLIARTTALGLGLIGLSFVAVYPLMRIAVARERGDIDRALAPLVSVPEVDHLTGLEMRP